MLRRDFGKASLGMMASSALSPTARRAGSAPGDDFAKTQGLTDYVGRFVATTLYDEIPEQVIELGKKSILDGLGLAIAGSKSYTGTLCRKYIDEFGGGHGNATIIGF